MMVVKLRIEGEVAVPEGCALVDGSDDEVVLPDGTIFSVRPVVATRMEGEDYEDESIADDDLAITLISGVTHLEEPELDGDGEDDQHNRFDYDPEEAARSSQAEHDDHDRAVKLYERAAD